MLNRNKAIPLAKTYLFTVFVYVMLDSRYSLPYNDLLRWIMPAVLIFAVAIKGNGFSVPNVLSYWLVVLWFLFTCFQGTAISYSLQRWISFCLVTLMHYQYYLFLRRNEQQEDALWLMGLCYVLYGALNFIFLDWGSRRMYGITGNPNSLGVWSVVSFLFAAYYSDNAKRSNRWIPHLIMVFNIVTAIGSGSRTYSVCILLDIVYVFYLSIRNKQFKVLVVLLGGALSAFLLLVDNSILLRIPGLARFVTEGTNRGYLWDYGIMLVREKPYFGHGYGISQSLNNLTNGDGGLAFHNSYITVAIETGLIGLSLVVVNIVSTSLAGIKLFFRSKQKEYAVLLMLIFNMLICFYGGSAMTSVGSTEGFFFWGLVMYLLTERKIHY